MAEIAKASGLSRQAIYLHFEDRGALIQALGRYADDRRGLDIEVEHVLENASGVEAMSRFVELLTRTNPGIWVLARAADAVRRTDPAVEDTWQERVRIRLKICVAIIERIRTEGMLREGMDVETAVDLLWTLTSLRMWEDLVEVRGWTPAKYSDYICNILATTLTRTLPGSGLGE